MTDGNVFKHTPKDLAEKLAGTGGIFYHLLKFGFEHFKDHCEAYCGHAGDKRAYEVDLRAGFTPTNHHPLIINFHKPISSDRKAFLSEKIHAIGPF